MLERYEARTGFDLSGIDYYVAFSSWRLAVISEGVYARYLHGAMADDGADIDTFRVGPKELAERAWPPSAASARRPATACAGPRPAGWERCRGLRSPGGGPDATGWPVSSASGVVHSRGWDAARAPDALGAAPDATAGPCRVGFWRG